MIQQFFDAPVFGLDHAEKQALLNAELGELTQFHRGACSGYRAILDAYTAGHLPGGAQAPFLPVSIFKLHDLASVPPEAVFKTMTSSGTTGQRPSRIFLDADTAQLQTRALARIMTSFIGPKRLPMLIIDHPSVIKDRRNFSARGAGILGMMTFGRDHVFALKDESMELDWDAINAFAARYPDMPIFAFGFTFMVWRHLLQPLAEAGRRLPFSNAILVHSGGWKKLEAEKVSNEQFKAVANERAGFARVHDFYGMVEQTGSVFVECEGGAPPRAAVFGWHHTRTARLARMRYRRGPRDPGRDGAAAQLPRPFAAHRGSRRANG